MSTVDNGTSESSLHRRLRPQTTTKQRQLVQPSLIITLSRHTRQHRVPSRKRQVLSAACSSARTLATNTRPSTFCTCPRTRRLLAGTGRIGTYCCRQLSRVYPCCLSPRSGRWSSRTEGRESGRRPPPTTTIQQTTSPRLDRAVPAPPHPCNERCDSGIVTAATPPRLREGGSTRKITGPTPAMAMKVSRPTYRPMPRVAGRAYDAW